VTLKFDPNKRPEENIATFFAYVREKDKDLAELLESRLSNGVLLSSHERQALARAAIDILRVRESDNNG